jgi:hypothetical protein
MMKTSQRLVFWAIYVLIAILLTVEKADAAIKNFYTNGTIQAGDRYQDVYCWANAIVNMTGGEVTRGLLARGYSKFNMYNGRIWLLRSRDRSTVTFNGGTVTRDLSCRDNSTLNFKGGQFSGDLWALERGTINFISGQLNYTVCISDYGTVNFLGGRASALFMSNWGTANLRGGEISNYIIADRNSIVNIYGYDFEYVNSRLSGFWADGTPFDIRLKDNFSITYDHIVFHEVPRVPAPPVADANGPYAIYMWDTLTLDASDSTDADDDIVSYRWDLDDDGVFETDAGGQAIFDVDYTYLKWLGLIVDNIYNIHLLVTDSEGQSDVADSTLIIFPPPAIEVSIDIKPGSCPNPVNVKSMGVLPAAILGSEDFDVNSIDTASIRLAGIAPIRNSHEDVASPVVDANECECTEDGPDGFGDLTLKFSTQEIVAELGEVNNDDVLVLMLTGVLYNETPIEGADCVLIRGKHKPINKADINEDGVVDIKDFAVMTENWLQSSLIED